MFYTANGKLIRKSQKLIEHLDNNDICIDDECISKNDIKLVKTINELSLYNLFIAFV